MLLASSPGVWFVGLVVLWLAAGAVAKRRSPVWHWYLTGYPMTWVRITRTWRGLCVERGLSVSRTSGRAVVGDLIIKGQEVRPIIPRVWVGRPRPDGMTVRIRLLPGQTPEQYAESSEAIMHAWRVHDVRVTSPERGFVLITVRMHDPLAGVVLQDPSLYLDGVTPEGVPCIPILTFSVGISESGRAWLMNLRGIPHWLIVGATRSGKSTLIHAIVARLAAMRVAIVGIDLKGGLELAVYGPRLSGLATTRKEAGDLLANLVELIMDRTAACRAAGVRAVWDLPEPPPPVIVIIDEIAELYLISDNSERAERDRATNSLLRVAQLGAALDVHVIAAGQRFGSELGPGATTLRSQLGGRVCLHVTDPESAVMVLGDLWPLAVAVAQMLTPEHQGFAVTADGEGSWMRARSMLTTPDQAAESAHRFASLAPVLPRITMPYDGRGDGLGGDE